MRRLFLTVLCLSLLTACSFGVVVTDRQLVETAIALQVRLSQQQLNQQLGKVKDVPSFKIDRVDITAVKPLTLQDWPAFQVRGTYDLTVQFPKRSLTQRRNPFEVYLQQQREGKTWRLLRPQIEGGEMTWLNYLIQ